MPPRIQLLSWLRPAKESLTQSSGRTASSKPPPSKSFSTSPSNEASTVAQRRRYRDPYAVVQAKARKAANLSRQEVLRTQRAAALGDPVRGITTPFVESFDVAMTPAPEPFNPDITRKEALDLEAQGLLHRYSEDTGLNHFLDSQTIREAQLRSEALAPIKEDRGIGLAPLTKEQVEDVHKSAVTAIWRIVDMKIGNSKDRLHSNIQRCVATFGRHNTDKVLLPKNPSTTATPPAQAVVRHGPDTGSSEVQIAILTAKIRTLANFLETRGKTDKVNKRNLRLLVHKRQKLLAYLRKRERGGPRWQNLIETLGLTEGTWRGEISL